MFYKCSISFLKLVVSENILYCYPIKAGLNQCHQYNPQWKKRPLMNPKNQCIFICVNLCVSVAFLKLFGINLAKKTNFYEVVVQRKTATVFENRKKQNQRTSKLSISAA
jgi:hypothetical protein